MKNLLTPIALSLALSGPVAAKQDHLAENCAALAGVAETMMMARQQGAPLAAVMQIAASDPTLREVMESMAMLAWSETRWNSPDMQRRAVSDFRDRMHLLCLGA